MSLHPELEPLTGLFDLPYTGMHENIGRRCRFAVPKCPAEEENYTVQTVQRIYIGEHAYRVVSDVDIHQFGRPALPHELIWLD